MAAISSSILLERIELGEGYRVEFYNKNEKVVAKVYHTNEKIGKCVLVEGLPIFSWTRESARSNINLVLKQCGMCIEPQRISVRESEKTE